MIRKVHKDETYWRRQRGLDLAHKEECTQDTNRCFSCRRDLFGNFFPSDFQFSRWWELKRRNKRNKRNRTGYREKCKCDERMGGKVPNSVKNREIIFFIKKRTVVSHSPPHPPFWCGFSLCAGCATLGPISGGNRWAVHRVEQMALRNTPKYNPITWIHVPPSG